MLSPMAPPSPRALAAMALSLLVAQLCLAAPRFDRRRAPPFSGRFSWSMFAGPLTGRCTHELRLVDASGRRLPWPTLRHDDPMRAVIDARTPPEVVRLSWRVAPYADRDADLAFALDDLLSRWSRTLHAPAGSSLTSDLRCASPHQPPFSRARRWPVSP